MADSYFGENIPKLGFGLMRLPKVDGIKENPIDVEATKKLVDVFLRGGYNYFDTAHVYQAGESEEVIKAALVERYPRESFLLADKLPEWKANKHEDLYELLDISLKRCGVEYFDIYLVHSLTISNYEKSNKYDVWSFMKDVKAAGKVKHIGFSFHGKSDLLDEILTAHPEFEVVQLQINYMDWESDNIQSRLNYEVCRKHNKPVIIMEPVKGGGLADMDSAVASKLKDFAPDSGAASWAFRWLAPLEGIVTILSGMTTLEQLEDNIKTFDNFKPLDSQELKVLLEVSDELNSRATTGCTACKYCIPECPQKINISEFMHILDDYKVYSSKVLCQHQYNNTASPEHAPADCTACGSCEEICPQSIKISEYMKVLDDLFGLSK